MGAETGHLRILMATRNGAPWLGAQLDSLVAQDHRNWSLWVSDDTSSDATRDILDRFDRTNPGRLERVLDGPGQGSAANFLHLVTHPDLPPGPVALADQDDVWRPRKLSRAAEALEQCPARHPSAYASRFYVTDHQLGRPRISRGWPRGASFENALVQNVMSGHSTVLNAAALALVRRAGRQVGGQAVPYHDWWIYQLMSGAGAAITLDAEPTLYYRQHGENVLGSSKGHSAWARRAHLAARRQFSGWVAENCAALGCASEDLSPQATRCLEAFTRLPTAGAGRARGLARLGIHRQSRAGTALLFMAAMFGQV